MIKVGYHIEHNRSIDVQGSFEDLNTVFGLFSYLGLQSSICTLLFVPWRLKDLILSLEDLTSP